MGLDGKEECKWQRTKLHDKLEVRETMRQPPSGSHRAYLIWLTVEVIYF